jgi:hypothetical protein
VVARLAVVAHALPLADGAALVPFIVLTGPGQHGCRMVRHEVRSHVIERAFTADVLALI